MEGFPGLVIVQHVCPKHLGLGKQPKEPHLRNPAERGATRGYPIEPSLSSRMEFVSVPGQRYPDVYVRQVNQATLRFERW